MKNRISRLFGILPIGAFILIILAYNIYYKTFVPLYVVIGTGILTGVVSTIFLKKTITRYFPATGLGLQFLYNTVTWGGYIVFFFLWMNSRYADNEQTKVTEKIIAHGYLRGLRGSSSQPYIIVHFDEMDKQIAFEGDTPVNFEHAELTIARGLFGYDVVKKYNLY